MVRTVIKKQLKIFTKASPSLCPGLYNKGQGLPNWYKKEHSGDPKQQKNIAFKRKTRPVKEQKYGKKLMFYASNVFCRLLSVLGVLEEREALQKLPGSGALQFHRI